MSLIDRELISLAQSIVKPEVVDITFNKNPFLKMLMNRGQVMLRGGDRIECPVLHNYNDAQWITGDDTLNTDTPDKRTFARYEWRDVVVPWKLNRTDIEKNMESRSRLVDLIQHEKDAAVQGMRNAMASSVFSAGGIPSGSNSPQIDGLQAVLGTGTYANINPNNLDTASDWQANTRSTPANTLTRGEIDRQWITASDDMEDSISLMVCNKFVFFKIMRILHPNERHMGESPEVSPGFQSIKWNHTSPILVDRNMPGSGFGSTDNELWFLDMPDIKLYMHSDVNFKFEGPREPYNQFVVISYVRNKAQIVIRNRRTHGTLEDINPAL